ncbi:MAG: hypothetical protein ACXAE3_00105 [Candidatus Kariarchaeaceae archaeon]
MADCTECGHSNNEETPHCVLCGHEFDKTVPVTPVHFVPIQLMMFQLFAVLQLLYFTIGLFVMTLQIYSEGKTELGLFVLPPMILLTGSREITKLGDGNRMAGFTVLSLQTLIYLATELLNPIFLPSPIIDTSYAVWTPRLNGGWLIFLLYSVYLLSRDSAVISYLNPEKTARREGLEKN